jgi:hypothetical protein
MTKKWREIQKHCFPGASNVERLPMASTVKLLFEMSSLDNASPATVSRRWIMRRIKHDCLTIFVIEKAKVNGFAGILDFSHICIPKMIRLRFLRFLFLQLTTCVLNILCATILQVGVCAFFWEILVLQRQLLRSGLLRYLFQTSIESIIEKTIGSTLVPVGGKRMQVFIDDISMPQITWKIVEFRAAMVTPGGGWIDRLDRLNHHLAVFALLMPDATSIERIYCTITE